MIDRDLFGFSLSAYLTGPWHLARRIDDRRANTVLSFTGEARFEPAADGLVYREEGALDTGSSVVKASQQHRWVFDGHTAFVTFADGRPFHRVAPENGKAADRHDCPPDLYDVEYTFDNIDYWGATWRVGGPRKDYTMHSRYTRLHRGAVPVQCPRD